jgi:glutamyl-tRNA synthetase
MTVRVRFAPSPTGYLHVGNIRAALINVLLKEQEGGEFILRLDDTDLARSTKEFAEAIKEDLAWLGLNPDEIYRQSERFEQYNAAAEKLKADGRLYPCYETPDELKFKANMQLKRGKPPVYDRAALKLTADEIANYEAKGITPHWRFKLNVPAKVEFNDFIRGNVSLDMASVSDPVLIRGDGSYLYSLPSVVDDLDMGITHVVRGEDHVTNSGVQVQIFEALGGDAPKFAHFSLFTSAKGDGLSKRDGALSVRSLRDEEGVEPMAILSLLARLGSSEAVKPETSLKPLVADFSFYKFSRGSVKFDVDELMHLNAKILHMTEFDTIKDRVDIEGFNVDFWQVVRPNLEKLSDVNFWWPVVYGEVKPVIAPEDVNFLADALKVFPSGQLTNDSWGELIAAVKEKSGRKGKQLFKPLRLALTGHSHGPEMKLLLPLMGADLAKARLQGNAA